MYSDIIEKMLDFSEDVRDSAWAAEMVRQAMLNSSPIISEIEYKERIKILYGTLEVEKMDQIFSGPTMARLRQRLSDGNIIFFERVRNALIDERNQANLTITVNSLDPEKEIKKKNDKQILLNRIGMEELINEITSNSGMPPVKFSKDDFAGNVEEFDEYGYDELDMNDVNHFFDTHWGLKAEIELNKILNPISRVNKILDNYDMYINDILACVHNFSRVFVDQIEGKIKIQRIAPYQIAVVHGKDDSNDYNNADAFVLRKKTNVRGFLRMFGTHFNFERDWNLLVSATYGSNAIGITGIQYEGRVLFGETGPEGSTSTLINLTDLIDMPIEYGYCEFKAISIVPGNLKHSINKEGKLIRTMATKTAETASSSSEDLYKEDTYYAYYFEPLSFQTPHIIKWGKLYMQNFFGQNDEYSGFSIKGNKREGTPVAVILKPFHNLLQISFKMTEMLIKDVKPDGLIINYSSILKVAEYLKNNAKDVPDVDKNGIDLFLKMVEESPNLLADTPETDEGDPIGGGNLGVQPKKNGLNTAANDLVKIIDWVEGKVEKYLGTQGIDVTGDNAGYKLSLENKKRARSATAFIDFILLNHLRDINITVLNYVQDISKYKDLPAYKYLVAMVGEKAMNFVGTLDKSIHRYGVFLDTFNNDIEMLEIRAMAEQARQNKEISLEQYMMVRSFENPKQAIGYLAYERKKTEKKQQQDRLDILRQQDALDEAKFQRQLKLEDKKGEWMKLARAEEAKGFFTAAQINANAQIAAKQIQEKGQNERLAANAVNEVDKIAKNAEANSQRSVPVTN